MAILFYFSARLRLSPGDLRALWCGQRWLLELRGVLQVPLGTAWSAEDTMLRSARCECLNHCFVKNISAGKYRGWDWCPSPDFVAVTWDAESLFETTLNQKQMVINPCSSHDFLFLSQYSWYHFPFYLFYFTHMTSCPMHRLAFPLHFIIHPFYYPLASYHNPNLVPWFSPDYPIIGPFPSA